MKELIKYMGQALVDKPDMVAVSEIVGEQTSVIELRVAKEDLGKVIGKQGRTAKAMRTILSAASTKVRKRTVLEIIEQAEDLVGRQVLASADKLKALPEGEYYWQELIGLEVVTEEGRRLGRVQRIFPAGGSDVYVC